MAIEFIRRSEETLGAFSVVFLFRLDFFVVFFVGWFGFVGDFFGGRIGLILFRCLF